MELYPLIAAAPVLAFAALSDLRHLRIPNALSLILIGMFVLTIVVAPPADWMARVVAAGVLFVVGFVSFAFGKIGAGDVKLLSALVLLIPFATLSLFFYLLAGTLAVGIVFILWAKRRLSPALPGWASLRSDRRFPMGISISAAGLLHPVALIVLGA